MRSSRSEADPLDPRPVGFAHRGLHGGAVPENSLGAFGAAIEIGAGIECDLRLTRDNRIVVFHDADAMRLCGRSLRIGSSTFSDVAQLRVGSESIPTIQDLLSLVRGRVPLLLELKVDRDIRRWVPALKPRLEGYSGPFGVMSFDPRVPRLLKANMPDIRRGLVVRDSLDPARRALALRLADPQFIAVERTALGKPWAARIRRRMPVYSWTIRTAAERSQAAVHADALIWEGDGRPRN